MSVRMRAYIPVRTAGYGGCASTDAEARALSGPARHVIVISVPSS